MTASSSRTRVAACAAGTAMAAALTLVGVPTAHAADTWGAIATGPNNKWRISYGQPDKSSAVYQARFFIAGGRLVLTFTDCGALVENDNGFSAASGATQPEAEASALADLPGSTVVTSACNAGSGAGFYASP